MISQAVELKCLKTDWLLSQFGTDRNKATIQYQNFVRSGVGLPLVWDGLNNQIFPGKNNFVENMQKRIKTVSNSFKEIPRVQRRVRGQPLSYYVDEFSTAKEGMQKAYATGDYTMQQIA
ncbi:MAG: addiction module toxin RelE, partial [Gammaproteobacteria bacterium]